MQTSRGKTHDLRCVSAGFIRHAPTVDGRLRCHVPARLGRTTPHIRFLFVAPHLWIGLPPDPASDDALALLLTFGSTNTWSGDSHPGSRAPCPAHVSDEVGLWPPSQRAHLDPGDSRSCPVSVRIFVRANSIAARRIASLLGPLASGTRMSGETPTFE